MLVWVASVVLLLILKIIEQGATAHGIDVDQLMEDLNAVVNKEA